MELPNVPQQRSFWSELYWFGVIGLVGLTVALAYVPTRASKYRRLLELEANLKRRCVELEHAENRLEAAILSMESDPFYREAVYRKVLGVKRLGEEFVDE